MDQPVVYALKTRVFFVERADRRPDDGGPVQVGDRIHLDITPYDKEGKEIPPGDPRIALFIRQGPGDDPHGMGDLKTAPGHGPGEEEYRCEPALQMRWAVNGKMNWHSLEEEDHFALQSYNAPGHGRDRDNGFTPVFELCRQVGPGTGTAEFWPFVAAADNGGLSLSGPSVRLLVD